MLSQIGKAWHLELPVLDWPVAQSVARLTEDPRVASSILAQSHTFVKIDHEIISTVILLPLIQEGLVSVTRKV